MFSILQFVTQYLVLLIPSIWKWLIILRVFIEIFHCAWKMHHVLILVFKRFALALLKLNGRKFLLKKNLFFWDKIQKNTNIYVWKAFIYFLYPSFILFIYLIQEFILKKQKSFSYNQRLFTIVSTGYEKK